MSRFVSCGDVSCIIAFALVLAVIDVNGQPTTPAPPTTTTVNGTNSSNTTNTTRSPRRVTQTLPFRRLLNRTRTQTFTVNRPKPTNRSTNSDDFTDNYEFYCLLVLKTKLSLFSPLTFASRILPAMPDATLAGAIMVIDYCGVAQDAAGAPSADWAATSCIGLGSIDYNYTVVKWAFSGSTGDSNYTTLRRAQITGLYSKQTTSTDEYFFKVLQYIRPTTSPAPGIVSRATDAALTPLGGFIIFVVIVLCIIGVFLVVRYLSRRKADREAAAAAASGVGLDRGAAYATGDSGGAGASAGSPGSPPVGDVYAAPPPAPGTRRSTEMTAVAPATPASSAAAPPATPSSTTTTLTKPAPNGTTQVVY